MGLAVGVGTNCPHRNSRLWGLVTTQNHPMFPVTTSPWSVGWNHQVASFSLGHFGAYHWQNKNIQCGYHHESPVVMLSHHVKPPSITIKVTYSLDDSLCFLLAVQRAGGGGLHLVVLGRGWRGLAERKPFAVPRGLPWYNYNSHPTVRPCTALYYIYIYMIIPDNRWWYIMIYDDIWWYMMMYYHIW